MYIHIRMYIYINTFLELQHLFPRGNSVDTSHMVHSRAKEKRIIKTIYWSGYSSFFSLKLAFDMMIFYCRLGEGRDKGSSF